MKINRSDDAPAPPSARVAASENNPTGTTNARRRLAAFALVVFAAAFGVRLATWSETRGEVGKVQTTVTAGYQRDARYLLDGGIGSFFSPSSPLANPDSLGHPPGYPVLLALVFKLFGESDAALQLFQIFCDALSCVLLFLVVAELLNLQTGLVAGLLAAVSPQLAWNSVLLLPDSLAVLPILCAVYLIARAATDGRESTNARTGASTAKSMTAARVRAAARRSNLISMFLAGALVGVSCWLRANALLLAPALAVFVFFLSARVSRLRRAASLLAGALVVVGVLTVRNAVVFRAFVPVSLGAGQTLLEG
ncbi:MAG: ArnT family glycosyltransferase, partial [Pyrinomonadaceae bacterium]